MCIFYKATGYYCPGCGGTRALISLLTGHPLQSLYYNPIVVYAVVAFIVLAIRLVIAIRRGTSVEKALFPVPVFVIAVVILAINTVVRNVLLIGYGIHI